jgi:CRP-like cAMP-binding protein
MAFRLLRKSREEDPMIPNVQRHSIAPQVTSSDDPRVARYRTLLSQTALFGGLAEEALTDLARRVAVRTRPAGTLIVAQDETGDAMFVLVSGRARVALFGESGRELTLSMLSPGDAFGEMALLDDRPRSASVQAVDDTTLLMISRETFRQHLEAHPLTAMRLVAELTRRLRAADETIASLALCDVEARLVRTLVRLGREGGHEADEGLVVPRRPTQQELANMVGSCRETISRTFTSLVRRGLLQPRGRAVLVTRALLERRAPTAA